MRRFPQTLLLVCLTIAGLALQPARVAVQDRVENASRETRALWVTRGTLATPAGIAQMVRAAQNAGFNTLIVQVRGRGDAYYRSKLEPRAAELDKLPDFDPLAQTLRLAHEANLIDVLCPMAYTQDADAFAQQVRAAQDFAGDVPVWAGVGAYRLSSTATVAHIAAARDLKAAGIILFSYDSLITPPNSTTSLAELGRSAFGTGSH